MGGLNPELNVKKDQGWPGGGAVQTMPGEEGGQRGLVVGTLPFGSAELSEAKLSFHGSLSPPCLSLCLSVSLWLPDSLDLWSLCLGLSPCLQAPFLFCDLQACSIRLTFPKKESWTACAQCSLS